MQGLANFQDAEDLKQRHVLPLFTEQCKLTLIRIEFIEFECVLKLLRTTALEDNYRQTFLISNFVEWFINTSLVDRRLQDAVH